VFREHRERDKTNYVAYMVEGLAKHPQSRFVGSFQTFDWLTLSGKPNAMFAIPLDVKSLPVKVPADEMFSLLVTTYRTRTPHNYIVSVDCKAREQEFTLDGSRVTATEAEGGDKNKFPRWIPALCGDWSKEIKAREERAEERAKERRRRSL
jgi:hypothetical protein